MLHYDDLFTSGIMTQEPEFHLGYDAPKVSSDCQAAKIHLRITGCKSIAAGEEDDSELRGKTTTVTGLTCDKTIFLIF